MTKRAVDFYSFQGVKGKRVAVDCAATGIDSKLTPGADHRRRARASDLLVNRTGGVIDFTPPADGTYLVKVQRPHLPGRRALSIAWPCRR